MIKNKRVGLKDNQIQELDDNDIDYDVLTPGQLYGSHTNLIPVQSAVQAPRLFYGARFYNQALPVANPEAPLIQNLAEEDSDGRSYDEIQGKAAGAVFADDDGIVTKVTPDEIRYKGSDGKEKVTELYHNFSFNRKTVFNSTPKVKPGDAFKKGSLLARSNFTDDNGTLAMGLNARVGLIPYKGHSMDDAIVISDSMAKRLAGQHNDMITLDFDQGIKHGLNHFVSLFPTKFKQDQLSMLDEDGVIKPGMKVKTGDPLVLATKPKAVSSSTLELGKLSKVMKQSRNNASQVWEPEVEGVVTDVQKNRDGVKVLVQSSRPTKLGDKVIFRTGQKGIVSKIIPDEHMPRTLNGEPLEVLQNPLGLPSRTNASLAYEILLGKVARKLGRPLKLPGFNKPGEKWYEMVQNALRDAGESSTEEVFDPVTNKKLDQPVTVGSAYMMNLAHVAEDKISQRGSASYDINDQPSRGSGSGAQSKRMSTLELGSLLSSGAYNTLRESSTLRGQKSDQYWRDMREGRQPTPPGEPFVWKKFHALLNGAGLNAKDVGNGKLRIGPMTDKDLAERDPIEIRNGEMVDLNTLEPVAGGLFDKSIVGGSRWGKITLPFKTIAPSAEDSVRHLLGLTKKQLENILAGKEPLPEHLR